MYFLEKVGGGVEGMNMLKQRHMNKFMFQLLMQWLTENLVFSKIVSQNKAPIHNKILLWTYVSLRLCSGKIIKAPEKCKQHIANKCIWKQRTVLEGKESTVWKLHPSWTQAFFWPGRGPPACPPFTWSRSLLSHVPLESSCSLLLLFVTSPANTWSRKK